MSSGDTPSTATLGNAQGGAAQACAAGNAAPSSAMTGAARASDAASDDAQEGAAMPAEAKLARFAGGRRRLPPDAPLFEFANLERQLALQDAVVQVCATRLMPAAVLSA